MIKGYNRVPGASTNSENVKTTNQHLKKKKFTVTRVILT